VFAQANLKKQNGSIHKSHTRQKTKQKRWELTDEEIAKEG